MKHVQEVVGAVKSRVASGGPGVYWVFAWAGQTFRELHRMTRGVAASTN